jgi:hypothetical protein
MSTDNNNSNQGKNVAYSCILCGQRIQIHKVRQGTAVALDEKGMQPHQCLGRTLSDERLFRLKSPGVQEAVR